MFRISKFLYFLNGKITFCYLRFAINTYRKTGFDFHTKASFMDLSLKTSKEYDGSDLIQCQFCTVRIQFDMNPF